MAIQLGEDVLVAGRRRGEDGFTVDIINLYNSVVGEGWQELQAIIDVEEFWRMQNRLTSWSAIRTNILWTRMRQMLFFENLV